MTKWIEVFALADKTAEEVTKCLVDEVFMRHGAPRYLITDRGSEFDNKLLKQVVRLLNGMSIRTTPANPRSVGVRFGFKYFDNCPLRSACCIHAAIE